MQLRIKSGHFISVMCSIAPFIVGRNPSAANLSPSSPLICVAQIVIAAADVNPEFTGVEIKLTMKPVYTCINSMG